ncbi:MAG: radical SAM protein [Planctomycetaceae bacterium]|nr:MAG: radical SAM protein [Planctomycetaceae bacterium]
MKDAPMRLVLAMPTGLQVGYDDYFSAAPTGLETLASHARQHADVQLFDMRSRGHDVEAHAEELLRAQPDIIGISLNSAPHTNYTLAIAAAIRRRRPDIKLIVGGQQATFLVPEMLTPGDFDAVIRGEGEITLTEILTGGKFAGVAGVSWRDGDNIVNEPDRPLIANLDDVLPPARELLPDRSHYRMGKYRVEGIESSRGCAFHCSFCSIRNFHRGKWRPKSVARVLSDIDDVLARYNEPMVIYFSDDNFTTDIRRVAAICEGIIERKSNVYFWCQARVDMLSKHPDVIDLMGKAHFAAVLAGIETPVKRLLASSRKGTSVEQILQCIDMLHKQDIGVWGTFTLGLPGETPEEANETADFVSKSNVDVAQITVATPIPGSDLYDEAKKNDTIFQKDWDNFDFTSPTMTGQMSKKELDAVMHKAYLKVYLSRRFLASLFTQKTNLSRLRRTAFGVFWTWIKFLIKERVGMLFGMKPSGKPH